MVEKQVVALQKSIEYSDETIAQKIDDMKKCVGNAEGRFASLERSLPERLHRRDERQGGTTAMINELMGAINVRIGRIESATR